jgi:hypothetical protein
MSETPASATPTPPTTPEPTPLTEKVVKVGRFEIAFNVFLQSVLVIALVVMANMMNAKYFNRFDWSKDRKYSLSNQTRALLGNLKSSVKAIVCFTYDEGISGDVQSLLREYADASKGKLEVEYVDPRRNLERANQLAKTYKIGANENVVILDVGGRNKYVEARSMAEFERQDQMAMMMGQPPRVISFKGEQVLTSTLLELVEEKPQKVYVISGHGEPLIDSRELTTFRETLQRQNVKTEDLKLSEVDVVPADASALFLIAPKNDISDRDAKLLTEYWDRRGNLIVGVGPGRQFKRLNQWLSDRGVTPRGDVMLRTGRMLGAVMLDMNVPAILDPSAGSPITKGIEGGGFPMLGETQSLAIDTSKTTTERLTFAEFMKSPKGYWGETEPVGRDTQSVPRFDPGKDNMGPVTLGVAVQKGASEDPTVKLQTAKLVVFGNGEFLTDSGDDLASGAGPFVAVNALNWMFDRVEMVGIPPREKTAVKLSLSEEATNWLFWWVVAIIPGAFAIFGVYYMTIRNSGSVLGVTFVLLGLAAAGALVWLIVGLTHGTIQFPK